MKTRMIVIASVAALAMGVGVSGVAATHGQGQMGGMGMMQAGGMMGGQSGNMTEGPRGSGMAGRQGMMGGSMMGMMSACPAMAGAGLDSKTAMQMHGEMMRAMGDILVKYADKMPSSPATP